MLHGEKYTARYRQRRYPAQASVENRSELADLPFPLIVTHIQHNLALTLKM
jgi:hypothetical protein